MKLFYKPLLSAVGVACITLASGMALAESDRYVCQLVGDPSPEALGDREGHSVWVGGASCRVEGGPMDGALSTTSEVWEWDKTTASFLSGITVTRKPGATFTSLNTEGKLKLVIAEGKVTGMTFSGRGRVTMATGSAAALSGKTYSWEGKTTGVGQYYVDVKYD